MRKNVLSLSVAAAYGGTTWPRAVLPLWWLLSAGADRTQENKHG